MPVYWIANIVLVMVGICASSDQASVVASPVSKGDPGVVIVVSPQDTESVAGTSVLLPCVGYSDRGAVRITWKKGEQLLVNVSDKFILHEQIVMNKSGLIFIKSILEICGVELTDVGNYSCVASVEGGQSDTASFELTTFTVPVQIIVAPMNENLTSSNTTIIWKCIALGYHHPTITWSRNGAELVPERSTSTMFVKGGVAFIQSTFEVCVDDTAIGDYKCIVSNAYTTTSSTFTLHTDVHPRILTPPTDQTITVSGSHNFTCDVLGFPYPSVTWTKDGLPLGTNVHMYIHTSIVQSGGLKFVGSILEVHHMKLAVEGGYKCVAENSLSTTSAGFHISAQAMKIIIAPDEMLMLKNRETRSLSCVAYGFPPPTIYWTKANSGNISSNSGVTAIRNQVETRDRLTLHKSVLEICSAQAADSGEYSCVADNGFTIESSHFEICVHNPVGMLLTPSNIELSVGTTFFLPCVAYSLLGPPQITWTAGDNIITHSNSSRITVYEEQTQQKGGVTVSRSVLVLSCAQPEDVNEYGCYVSIGQDTSGASFQISLLETTTEQDSTSFTSSDTRGLNPVPSTTGLGHGSYVGGLISIIFLLPVVVLYLAFKKLRSLPISVPLVNLCIALIALNISIVASYTRAIQGTENIGCDVLAFLFHYFFLVATLGMANMVLLCVTAPTMKMYLQVIAMCINWGLPMFTVIFACTPDPPNYTSGLFCGPSQWALWFGLVLPFVLAHIITWFLLIVAIIPCTLKTNDDREPQCMSKNLQNAYKFIVLLFVFDFTWGVGLPATYNSGILQVVLQVLFLVASILLGALIFLLFGLLPKNVRHIFRGDQVNNKQSQPTSPYQNDDSISKVEDVEAPKQINIQDVPTTPQENHPPIMRLRIGSLTTMSVDEMSLTSPGVQTKTIEVKELVNGHPYDSCYEAIPENESNPQTTTAANKRYQNLEKSEIINATYSM